MHNKKNFLYLIIFFICLTLFASKIFTQKNRTDIVIGSGDILYQGLPFSCFIKEYFNSYHTLPLWNDSVVLGYPCAAGISQMMFHPFSLLLYFKIFSLNNFYNFLIIIYLLFSGLFTAMYIFSKTSNIYSAFISAILFMFGGFTMNSVLKGHYMLLGSYCFYPLVFLIVSKLNKKKFYSVILVLIISLQILAGHPQQVYFEFIILYAYIIFCSHFKNKFYSVLKISLIIFAAALLCAVQLVPSFLFSKESIRSLETGITVSQQYSLSLNHFIMMFFPFLWGTSLSNNFILKSFEDYSIYFGVSILSLMIIGILFLKKSEIRFWYIAAIITVIISFGEYLPVYKFFYNYFPGFKMFRGPVRILSLTLFSIAILSGLIINEISKKNIFSKLYKTFFVLFTIFYIFTAGLIIFSKPFVIFFIKKICIKFNSSSLFKNILYAFEINNETSIFNNILIYLSIFLISLTIIFFLMKANQKKIFLTIFSMIVFIELYYFAYRLIEINNFNSLVPDKNSKIYNCILSDKTLFRIKYNEQQLNINKNCYIYGLKNIEGYQNIIYRNTAIFQMLVNNNDDISKIIKSNRIFFENYNSNILKLTGLKYVIATEKLDETNFDLIAEQGTEKLYLYKKFLPFIFPVETCSAVKEKDYSELNKITDFKKVALLFPDDMNAVQQRYATDNCIINQITYNCDKLSFNIKNSTPQFIIVLNPFDKDWKFYLNNRLNKLYNVDFFVQGFSLPAGQNYIELRYEPNFYKFGKIISLITLFSLICLSGYLICIFHKYGLTQVSTKCHGPHKIK